MFSPTYATNVASAPVLLARATAKTQTENNNRQPNTAFNQNNNEDRDGLYGDRQDVTIENSQEVFEWYENYGVPICNIHCYAVRKLASHLRGSHNDSVKGKKAIANLFHKS